MIPIPIIFPISENFVQISDSLRIQIVSQFYLKKTAAKKKNFSFLKSQLFRNGWPYWYECWCVLRDFCELSKKCGFATFTKIWPKLYQFEYQSRPKFNCPWKVDGLLLSLFNFLTFFILNFIRPCANIIFNIYNLYGIKLLIRLRQGFSQSQY